MTSLQIWIEAIRPKTLPASVVPVLLATAIAEWSGAWDWRAASICLGFALLVQIGTNFANDYLDGIKGTDTDQRLGPQRAVAAGLISPCRMKWAAIAVLAVAFCLGLALIPFGGWWLLGVGVASVACAWAYTGGPYPLAYKGLGDVFVVLFFGFVAVGCSFYVQTGYLSGQVLLLGLGCGLLVNNILVVNNYRDLEEDRKANKRTLVVLMGRPWARMQYVISTLWAGSVVVWFASVVGWPVLIALLPIVYSLYLSTQLTLSRSADDYMVALKGSAFVVFAYGVLFSIGILVS